MKDDYARLVGIANEGAKELGFADTGAMWRSGYDMPPAEFAKLTEKIWQDMKPLYVALHTYVRWKLNEKYGDAVQAKTGPIRADLLGNMRSEEHTSELQSLMRISYAVFCLTKKKEHKLKSHTKRESP